MHTHLCKLHSPVLGLFRTGRSCSCPPGYKVSIFKDGISALDSFKRDPGSFDLVVTDMAMLKMTGDELAAAGFPGKKGIIMLNPQYGKRIEKKEDIMIFYNEISKKLKSDFRGWRLGMIIPLQLQKQAILLSAISKWVLC